MEDIRIPAIVGRIVFGLYFGMTMIADLGLRIFGPIGNNPNNWIRVGGLIGAALYVWIHYQHKKRYTKTTK